MAMRPKRSWLFAPGSNARMCDKALTSGADCVILDLEDAVALDAKPEARRQVRALLDRLGDGAAPVYVRVNGTKSGLLAEDVAAVVVPTLAGIVFPMAETRAQVEEVDALIGAAEARAGMAAGAVEVVCLIETAAGLFGAREVAAGAARVAHLGFGAGDLCGDLGIPTTNEGPHMLQGKVWTVWASRAAGIQAPLDTVYFDLQNPAGFEADCEQAKALGFLGKTVIHPAQVEPANRIMAPSDGEIDLAWRIVEAFRAAEAAGTGAIRVDGKLIDYAMVKSAEKILAVATTLGRHPG